MTMARGPCSSLAVLACLLVGALLWTTTTVLLRSSSSSSSFKNHPLLPGINNTPENLQEQQQQPHPPEEDDSPSLALTEDATTASTSIAERQRHRDLLLFFFELGCTDRLLTTCENALARKKELCPTSLDRRRRELIFFSWTWPWGWPLASCSVSDLDDCFDEYYAIECPPEEPENVDLSGGSARYCAVAQSVISKTSVETGLEIKNVQLSTFAAFADSAALPYEGATTGQPWTTQQYVSTSSASGGGVYEQTISCKMKNGYALNRFFTTNQLGGGLAIDLDCAHLAESFVLATLAQNNVTGPALSLVENAVYSVWVALKEDEFYESETASAPAPVAYLDSGGVLNIVSKQYIVDIEDDDAPKSARGIEYCQFIAPAYVELIAAGTVTPPTCTAPPDYEPDRYWLIRLWNWFWYLFFGSPDPTVWDCKNP